LCLLAAYGKIHKFLRLLAVRFSTSCISNVLAGKPQKHDIFTSCGGLHVLAVQELLVRHFLRVHYFWAALYLEVIYLSQADE